MTFTVQPNPRRALFHGVLPELRMLGDCLPIGASSHGGICPFCRGGAGSERSFSITRLDATRCGYYCHRASCGAHGFVGGTSGIGSQIPRRHQSAEIYTLETRGLGSGWLSKLRGVYGFSEDQISQLSWTEEVNSGRLVVYVRDPDGKRRGIHTRSGDGSYPRTRDYREGDDNWMGWYRGLQGIEDSKSAIILVEDVLSAAKVSCAGFTCASLMGTSYSVEKLLETQTVAAGRSIVLALDKDATSKAIAYAREYSFLLNGTLVPLLLSKDMKYHTTQEILQMVQEVVRNT